MASELSAEDRESLVTRSLDLLNSGENKIELDGQRKKVVLVLSDTGQGKSKFTLYVAGDNSNLISIETEEHSFIIEDVNDTGRSIITSETIYPHLVFDGEIQVPFYDCPGWNDTRDASNEVATTYFIKKVVDHAESVKLIFAINYPSVRKGVDRHNFMKLVKHISDFITNIDKFQKSIFLIVTKVDYLYVKKGDEYTLVDSNQIIAAVANFLIEVKEELKAKLREGFAAETQLFEVAIRFISILLFRDGDHYPRMGIFRRPDQPGPISEIPLLQEEKMHIKRLIHEKLVFTKKEHDDFGYTISEKCKNKIHYLVDDINTRVWSCLCRLKDQIKEYYERIINVTQSTIESLVDETLPSADLHEAKEMSICLKNGCRNISSLVKELESVTNPEHLAQRIRTVVTNLNIDISKDDLLCIENMGKYFNFLQVVSDRRLSIRPWDKLFREVGEYLSDAWKKLQEVSVVIAPKICKQIGSDFQKMAKSLRDEFDEKTKSSDMNEALEELNHYLDAMIKVSEKTEGTMTLTELFKIVNDLLLDIKIILPEQNMLNALQKEKSFIFLQAFGETDVKYVPCVWTHPFQSVVNHLNESKIWYRFLDDLFATFSEYEIQKNREMYNVVRQDDWEKTGKPQGIVITKNNFAQFLRNIANCNFLEFDYRVNDITLTELRLDELNQILNLTLKHRIDVQKEKPSIFIRADYISLKEISGYSENGHNLLAALKSGKYEGYKILHIFATRTVFIDEDILLPGLELRIVSPKWEIISTRIINLNGVNGEPHLERKAKDGDTDDSKGKVGKPGSPGKPGGNFFGIAASIINGANLTVTVNGGSGGPGQDGGNGGGGRKGEAVGMLTNEDMPEKDEDGIKKVKGFPCEKVKNWSGINIIVSFVRMFGVDLAENTLYKIPGSPGGAAGDGGNGGAGGIGGNPGHIHIFDLSKDSGIRIYANKGSNGVGGRGGKGGNGGRNGDTWYGLLNGILMTKWMHQFVEPDENVSPELNGSSGDCGRNSCGIEAPERSNAVHEPFKIIDDYKMYAKQNLQCRYKKVLLFHFIDLLYCDDEIKSLCAVDS